MSYPLRKRFRVSLRTLLLLVTVSAVAAALVSRFYFRPGPTVRITTHAAWDNATKNGQCVVFVDGGWNTNMAAFGIPFGKFADWCHTHTKTRTLTMMIQNDDDAVFGICDQLWRTNNIPLRGMKHYGGRGVCFGSMMVKW